MEELKYRLKVYIRALEGIQGEAYDILLARATQVYESIWGADLLAKEDQWYKDFSRDSINFETYEPDRVPPLIAMEQRLGGTGNAFIDFTMNVMQGDTVYGPAFNGKRKKAAEMEDWLKRDINWNPPTATNEEGKIQFFREAFMRLTEARKEHEAKTGRVVMKNLLDEHERVYADNSMFDNSKVEDISEFLEEEQ